MQTRPGPAQLNLKCGNYRLILMSPGRVTDAWARWVADPVIMQPMGVNPRVLTKQQLGQYVVQMQAQQRAVIGIFSGPKEQHVGLVEVSVDRRHLTANIEILIDTRNNEFASVAGEVLPGLVSHLSSRFKIEKFIALIPETYDKALDFFASSGWSLEAELEEELFAPAHGRRVNVRQYAWFKAENETKALYETHF